MRAPPPPEIDKSAAQSSAQSASEGEETAGGGECSVVSSGVSVAGARGTFGESVAGARGTGAGFEVLVVLVVLVVAVVRRVWPLRLSEGEGRAGGCVGEGEVECVSNAGKRCGLASSGTRWPGA